MNRLSQRNGFAQHLKPDVRTQHSVDSNIDMSSDRVLNFHQEATEIE